MYACMYAMCVHIQREKQDVPLATPVARHTTRIRDTGNKICMYVHVVSSHRAPSRLVSPRLVSSASQGFACMRCSRQAGGLGSLIEAAIWGRRRDWAGAARIPARRVEGRACARVPLWSAARKPITYTDRERRARAMRRWNYIGDGEAIE